MLRARLRWQSKSQERLLDHEFSRSISFLFSHKDSSQRLMWALMMYHTESIFWPIRSEQFKRFRNWFSKSKCPGARLDLTVNFHHVHFIDPTNCPWVSKDEMADDAHRSKISKLCRLCGKIASSNTFRPRNGYDSSCYTTPHFSNAKFIYTWNFHFGIARKLKKCSFYKTIWFWRAVQRKIVLMLENMRGSDCWLKFQKRLTLSHFQKLL